MSKEEDHEKESFSSLEGEQPNEIDEEIADIFSNENHDDVVVDPAIKESSSETKGEENEEKSFSSLKEEEKPIEADGEITIVFSNENQDDILGDPAIEKDSSESKEANKKESISSLIGGEKSKVDGEIASQIPNKYANYPVATSSWKSITNRVMARTGKFPEDTYSFLALHGPMETKKSALFFMFGLIPFVFQMLLLILLAWSETKVLTGTIGENDNPSAEGFASFIPSNTSPIVKCTQWVAILTFISFPDASTKDIISAAQLFPQSSRVKSGDPVLSMRFSCLLRGIQGILAMLVTLLLIATSDTVVDIILNFTAVNFVSGLDDYAFGLAVSGDFGPTLQDEAVKIADTNLPSFLYRDRASKFFFNKVVVGISSIILFALLGSEMIVQQSEKFWVTRTFRVQFQESTGLNKYSGCYRLNRGRSSMHFSRRSYRSLGGLHVHSAFGYCRAERRWLLFDEDKDKTMDPCNATRLAGSPKTDTFDISTSFDGSWVSGTNTPLDMYFFDTDEADIEKHCNSILGDGICDLSFNKLGYDFDGGDCCATTCTSSECGRGEINSIFGYDIAGTHFPNCFNPAMVPITIQLNDIKSSRDPEFAVFKNHWDEPWNSPTGEVEWRNAKPVDAYFALDCMEKNVLTVYINKTMETRFETVMIDNGASCVLEVRSSTTENVDIARNSPIWVVNYTLFHGSNDTIEDEGIPILTQQSNHAEIVHFKRIPTYCVQSLRRYVDIKSIYTGTGPNNEAIKWLVEKDQESAQCEEEFFLDRYALSTVYFALGGSNLLRKGKDQCTWPSITCSDGQVKTINIQSYALAGGIPTELQLLQELEVLDVSFNQVTSLPNFTDSLPNALPNLKELLSSTNQIKFIPCEIGMLTKIEHIDLSHNDIMSIPIEIGSLTNLKYLNLAENLIESIPPEIESLTNLKNLDLGFNSISSIPKEIGSISNVEVIDLTSNNIHSIPREMGNLTNIIELNLPLNDIWSIPSEIGLLKKLEKINLSDNNIWSIPSEIGLLTKLEKIDLTGNSIESIPTEFGLLSNLKEFTFQIDNLTSIPSEIRFLTDLKHLLMVDKNIQSIPSEIGQTEKLEKLLLFGNDIATIPTQVGMLKQLKRIDLTWNRVTAIPTEIGSLTNLEVLEVAYNNLISIPSEIGNISKLQRLSAAFNSIISLPSDIGMMMQLKELDLDFNNIMLLPSEIGRMSTLQSLSVLNNNISSIPTEIGYMSGLQSLHLGHNNVASIPTEIGLMKHLTVLDFTNNNISSIPTEIGLLSNLEFLSFASNQIESIPTEIRSLTNLEVLHLSSNQIGSIPSELGLIPTLKNLTILNNNVTFIPTEIEMMPGLVKGGDNSSNDCTEPIIDLECPELVVTLINGCAERPRNATFEYTGFDCGDSTDFMSRRNFTCIDQRGGPSSKPGAEAYITAVSNGGRDLHFQGAVTVGESFFLNELPSDLEVKIFRFKNGPLLQTIGLDVHCDSDLYVHDRFGSLDVLEWTEPSGRKVSAEQWVLPERPTFQFNLNAINLGNSPLRLKGQMLSSKYTEPVYFINMPILEPGAPTKIRGVPINIDDHQKTEYVFFWTFYIEEDGSRSCRFSSFKTCILGFNLRPD